MSPARDEHGGDERLPQRLVGWNAEARDPQRQVDKHDSRPAEDDEEEGYGDVAAISGHDQANLPAPVSGGAGGGGG